MEAGERATILLAGAPNSHKAALCEAWGLSHEPKDGCEKDMSCKNYSEHLVMRFLVAADKDARLWKNMEGYLKENPYEILMIAGEEDIDEYIKLRTEHVKKSYLIVQKSEGADLTLEKASELAEKY
jgi:hypothetical protein